MPRTKFGKAEFRLVGQAMEVAEDRVSDHFQLSDATWLRYPYEVRTLADLGPREVAPRALAQVLRLRKPPRPGRVRAQDFFRICLQDHNLLGAVRREGRGDLLLPLLTYVLTHELVHVVRFYRFLHLFEATASERAREEARVHAITTQVLERIRLPHLDEVLRFYQDYEGEDWAPVDATIAGGDVSHAHL